MRKETKTGPEDSRFMAEALRLARKAARMGEVPVGAVVVREGEIIGRGYNRRETAADPTAHAEIVALRRAARKLGGWRAAGTVLYVTLEPCLMCIGAVVLARVERLVFGAFDPKAGACGSLYDIPADRRLNHRVQVTGGVLGDESGTLLREFFAGLRKGGRDGTDRPQRS
ncbi:MAG TPA: nucleoside deaminase [Deltaproteobacteria bacterium]|nr:nucleoside deaminase [Deltaproteobacteria bacterium]